MNYKIVNYDDILSRKNKNIKQKEEIRNSYKKSKINSQSITSFDFKFKEQDLKQIDSRKKESICMNKTKNDLFLATDNLKFNVCMKQSNYNGALFGSNVENELIFEKNERDIDNHNKNNQSGLIHNLIVNKLENFMQDRSFNFRQVDPLFVINDKKSINIKLDKFLDLLEKSNSFVHKYDDNKENYVPLKNLIDSSINMLKQKNEKKRNYKINTLMPKKIHQERSKKALLDLSNVENRIKKNSSDNSLKKNFDNTKRMCFPRHRYFDVPLKPSIKYHNSKLNIFIINSLTKLIKDATRFGTEFNSSGHENLPLPDETNEIVKIPAETDLNSKRQKIAIIKAFPNKYFLNSTSETEKRPMKKIGFYNHDEFLSYQKFFSFTEKNMNEFDILHYDNSDFQNKKISYTNINILNKNVNLKKKISNVRKVRWADVLEW